MSEPVASPADTTEEVQADMNPSPEAAPPALNRAQRRAQAQGKKGANTVGAANLSVPHSSNLRGPGGQSTGNAGVAARFQRKTGGK